jgi:phenylacetate-CoA ligase
VADVITAGSGSHFDELETRDPAAREGDLLARLPAAVAAALQAPAYRERLGGVDPGQVNSRAALAALPVLRKADLPGLQQAAPPFGGLLAEPLAAFGRFFASPGPIFEPEGREKDPWRGARALYAAGFRPGDVVLNTFSYHLVPAGFIMDSAARALDCPVIPAGPASPEQQLPIIAALKPAAYCGTPDFLKILLDAHDAQGRGASPFRKALVSGAAFPISLQDDIAGRGVAAFQAYATADFGFIAYESEARDGLIINEDLIVEIVRPGTGDPVSAGEVGEIVVTSLDPLNPRLRLALGDLTAAMPGVSPCGRANMRIRGWMGRADQAAKVKGLFVRPEQVAAVARQHPELGRLRLVVTREGERDVMTLLAEAASADPALAEAVAATLRDVTRLSGAVDIKTPGTLPNDGKVIADERPAP